MFGFLVLDDFPFGLIQSLLSTEKMWNSFCGFKYKMKCSQEWNKNYLILKMDAEVWTEWTGLNQNVHIGLKLIDVKKNEHIVPIR